jgi:hypothetical protein
MEEFTICPECGNEFTSRKLKRFCSEECRIKYYNSKLKTAKCPRCGKPKIPESKLCRACRIEDVKTRRKEKALMRESSRILFSCLWCKQEIQRGRLTNTSIKYCGMVCRGLYFSIRHRIATIFDDALQEYLRLDREGKDYRFKDCPDSEILNGLYFNDPVPPRKDYSEELSEEQEGEEEREEMIE